MRAEEWVWTEVRDGAWSLPSRGVYAYLLARRNTKTKVCYPTIETIAADLSIGTTAAKKYIAELVRLGLITKRTERNGIQRKSIYYPHVYEQAPAGIRKPGVAIEPRVHQSDSVSRDGRNASTRQTFSDGRNASNNQTGRNASSNSPIGVNSRGDAATEDVPPPWEATAHPPEEMDDYESLPLDALPLVLAWHESEDARAHVAEPTIIRPGCCSRCDLLLTADERGTHGMCPGCLDRVPEHDEPDWWPWWDDLTAQMAAPTHDHG